MNWKERRKRSLFVFNREYRRKQLKAVKKCDREEEGETNQNICINIGSVLFRNESGAKKNAFE